jgi:hypothetical protein
LKIHTSLLTYSAGFVFCNNLDCFCWRNFASTRWQSLSFKRIDSPDLEFAIVKRIVEPHGGEFGLESGEGIGSIVRVQLPLDDMLDIVKT